MALSESLNAQAVRELRETKCPACGKVKRSNQSFCHTCYYRLPQPIRSKLYRTFGEGYVDAWSEAKDWLRDNAD